MSFPNIPNISPEIKLSKKEVVHLLMASIAMEELSLSHILNAEGEKIQHVLSKNPSLHELMHVNRSVERMLRNVIKQEMLLQFKFEDILEFKQNRFCEEFEEEERCREEEECEE